MTRTRLALAVLGLAAAVAYVAIGPRGPVDRAAGVAAILALAVATAVDLERLEIPNAISLGGAAVALATSPWRAIGLKGAALGAVGALLVTVVPAEIYKRARKQSGAGFGDAKLLVFAGAWLGAWNAAAVFFFGAVFTVLAASAMRALRIEFPVPPAVAKEIEALRERAAKGDAEAASLLADDPIANEGAGMRLPMGPFLALAAAGVALAGDRLRALVDNL